MKKTSLASAGIVTVALLTALASSAQALTLITNRANLGANDNIDWSTLGDNGTSVNNPFSIGSVGGNTATVSQATGEFERRNQDNGWNGNFASGDALLWTQFNPGGMTIDFGNLVRGGGAQIQANTYGAFTAFIEAFDSLGNSLGSFSLAGNSTDDNNNSAIFIGVTSDRANIDKLVFSINDNGLDDFAINQLGLVSGKATVPEPTTILGTLMFSSLGGGLWFKRKRRR